MDAILNLVYSHSFQAISARIDPRRLRLLCNNKSLHSSFVMFETSIVAGVLVESQSVLVVALPSLLK